MKVYSSFRLYETGYTLYRRKHPTKWWSLEARLFFMYTDWIYMASTQFVTNHFSESTTESLVIKSIYEIRICS